MAEQTADSPEIKVDEPDSAPEPTEEGTLAAEKTEEPVAAEVAETPSDDKPETLVETAADEVVIDPPQAPTPEPEIKPGPAPIVPPVPVQQPRIASGPGFMTLLLGGVIAGIIGFLMSEYKVFGSGGEDRVAVLEQRVSDQSGQIAQANAQAVEAAEAAAAASLAAGQASEAVAGAATPGDIAAVREEIAALPAPETGSDADLDMRLTGVEAQLADLSAQLANMPTDTGASSETLDAYAAQLATLQEELDGQRAAIADATAAAADARNSVADETRRISVQAALAQIGAALENGAPFIDATSGLETAGGITVPAALADTAASGVATLAALQDRFPDAARAALSVSIRETSGGGAMDRFGAFLRSQTGARSLGAREGDDPDAVLSRAEAAVQSGDVATALSELAALPGSGQDAMASWTTDAQARLAAASAWAELSAATNSN